MKDIEETIVEKIARWTKIPEPATRRYVIIPNLGVLGVFFEGTKEEVQDKFNKLNIQLEEDGDLRDKYADIWGRDMRSREDYYKACRKEEKIGVKVAKNSFLTETTQIYKADIYGSRL